MRPTLPVRTAVLDYRNELVARLLDDSAPFGDRWRARRVLRQIDRYLTEHA